MVAFPTKDLSKLLSKSNERVAPKAQRVLGAVAAGDKARTVLGSDTKEDERARKLANEDWTREHERRRREETERVLQRPVSRAVRQISHKLRADSQDRPPKKALALLGDDELTHELVGASLPAGRKAAHVLGDSVFVSPKSRMVLGSSEQDGIAYARANKFWEKELSAVGRREFLATLDGARAAASKGAKDHGYRHSDSTVAS